MQTVHYNVSGLAGSQSKTKLLNALDEIKGVQEVAIDLARGTVEVEYNPPAGPQQIRNCIEHTGYEIQ
ncbi:MULTISPECIES: heavy-metal-associated domain-containing protein [unclassified Clostridium]|uniref:heavy-metal-associated domain-containing protein n=1 Tax=unclassified Clostridium TaxID=2614128 RepID=UPI00052E2C09|nr:MULTISPECIES: heavy metal-associated domain-containing protein [unclassified Clostridium]KGK85822.1 heavy metal transporter [Clostridium sp. HMP27]